MNYDGACTNCSDSKALEDFPVAMAYVPWQSWNGVCKNLNAGFEAGTIFKELEKPLWCYNS